MKNSKQFIGLVLVLCSLIFFSCKKLQDGYDYNSSFYDTDLKMSVMDFMKSRPDLFSGMMAAIEYVDQDPAYKDVKEMYSTTGNTFLLLHNNALTNLEDANSYWVLNKLMGPDPYDPTKTIALRGSDWSQYNRDTIANLLRYHVLKGTQTYSTLNSIPKWVETFASSVTNDSAKVFVYLENVREANLRLNNYIGIPTVYKGTTVNWTNIAPRTPDLHATNGVVHVMNRFLFQPTREAIDKN
ncbi:fasciclin domain-containing protein [Terrimonas alba]|uniref:fasciclin domain-containing protein n=1 Tax=Terrimonas alba TaxID=3349636 RepID=UPI0035F469A3